MLIIGYLLAIVSGIGSLVCFVMVLIHFFNTGQTGLGIACIVLIFCGIGGLIAYVKGWMDNLGNIMLIWTACIVVSIIGNVMIMASAPALLE